jgi:cytidine deaminase
MKQARQELILAATSVRGEFNLREDYSAGGVGAAIRTAKGTIYTGICIDLACGIGFCAEVSAIAEMLKNRETQIVSVVAVSESAILPPCGRCRETMALIDARNLECRVILGDDEDARLKDLLPKHWLDAKHK